MTSQEKEFLAQNIYTIEREGHGHTIIISKSLDVNKPIRALKDALTEHLLKQISESSAISKSHGNERSYVHVYMNGCMLKHYSFNFYRRLFTMLQEKYQDILEAAYIYDMPAYATYAWEVIRLFIDADTRNKIHMITSKS